MKTDGPQITISSTCFGCKHCSSEYYNVQGDTGHDVYCGHPDVEKKPDTDKKYIGFSWGTPDWCPLKKTATEAKIKEWEQENTNHES